MIMIRFKMMIIHNQTLTKMKGPLKIIATITDLIIKKNTVPNNRTNQIKTKVMIHKMIIQKAMIMMMIFIQMKMIDIAIIQMNIVIVMIKILKILLVKKEIQIINIAQIISTINILMEVIENKTEIIVIKIINPHPNIQKILTIKIRGLIITVLEIKL